MIFGVTAAIMRASDVIRLILDSARVIRQTLGPLMTD